MNQILHKEGYLEKRGHFIKNWKLRWFILDGVSLTYTENNKTKRPCGRINLEGSTIEESSTLMKRPYTFTINTKTAEKKVFYITAANNEEYLEWFNLLTNLLAELSGVEITKTTISKRLVDFHLGEEACPLGEPLLDELVIFNNTTERVNYKLTAPAAKTYDLSFSTNNGVLQKYESTSIQLKISVNDSENINVRMNLSIEDDSHFIYLKLRGATGMFGTNPSDLEQVEDDGYTIPLILSQMKNCMVENGGLQQEGIFRIAGEASDIKRVKILINQSKFTPGREDPNTMATLIKIWFRELPEPILNVIPPEYLHNSGDVETCIQCYQVMKEPQKTLFDWLLDFLMVVTSYSSANKMSLQNIAIVIAPNLYESRDSDPMEGLMLSQKCAQFLHNLLQWKSRMLNPQ